MSLERIDAFAHLTRRVFLAAGAGGLAGGWCLSQPAAGGDSPLPETEPPRLRFGLVTDLHHADKDPAGTRHYRDTIAKLSDARVQFERSRVEFVVELGDVVDASPSLDEEKGYLRRIQQEIATLPGRQHWVLGNHCVDNLTKNEFLEIVGQAQPHYSFDLAGWHFVVLDACYRSDGTPYGRENSQWTDANLPEAELEWLRADLRSTAGPTIVFIHQRLDVADNYAVKNAAAIRQVLEAAGHVRAVFQGHYHKNAHTCLNDIHYVTLAAMVEGPGVANNAFAVVSVLADGRLQIEGFGKQTSYTWPPP